MSLAVVSIGTAVPDTVIDQRDSMKLARSLACLTEEQDLWLQRIYSATQIDARHINLDPQLIHDVWDGVSPLGTDFLPTRPPDGPVPTTGLRMEHYARLAPPLACAASTRALAEWDGSAGDLTHLVTVSCTGFSAPGIDYTLTEHLGLRRNIERTQVGFMTCHGALNGLRVARAFTAADERARVLLCAVELCSLHYHYGWNPQKMIGNAIFADGAAALVGVPTSVAPPGAWHVAASGSYFLPNSDREITWSIGDHGFEVTLTKNGPLLVARHLRPWITEWLDEQGMSVKAIRSWGIHPGGPRVLDAAAESLGLTEQDIAVSREVFAAHGNMSSPTILFILRRLIESDAPRPCVCVSFGPGLAVEAALLV